MEDSKDEKDRIGSVVTITPSPVTEKRKLSRQNNELRKKIKRDEIYEAINFQDKKIDAPKPRKWTRVFVGVVDDPTHIYGFHPVFGYTKHWNDKEYVKLKRDQVLTNIQWWRDMMNTIHEDCDELYDQVTVMDKFWEEYMQESTNIEDNIEEYDQIILNVLNKEALTALINWNKNDAAVSFLYNLIHFTKMSVYKAECNSGFESVTVFQNDGVLCGEIILEAGKTFEWRKMNCLLED